MAETRMVLGQAAPNATTETVLYTVPASTQVVSSSIVICNRSAQSDAYRISVSVGGGATAAKDYIAYGTSIAANDSVVFTIGLTLGAADVVRVYAGTANLSFSMYGVQLT